MGWCRVSSGSYKLQGPVVCDFWNQGLNDSYIVRSKRGKYVLRVYRAGWRTRREILSELDLLNYLHRQKVPVSRPIRRGDGRYLQGVEAPEGRRYAALFLFAPGKVAIDSRKAYRYGALAATIHASTDRQSKRHPRFHLDLKHLLEDPLAGMAVQLQHRRHDLDYLHGVATGLAAKIRELLPTTTPEYGVCHGDLHHGNVHFGDDDEMTIFDFDCWGYGWRMTYQCSTGTTVTKWERRRQRLSGAPTGRAIERSGPTAAPNWRR